jgi:hypothetical protein
MENACWQDDLAQNYYSGKEKNSFVSSLDCSQLTYFNACLGLALELLAQHSVSHTISLDQVPRNLYGQPLLGLFPCGNLQTSYDETAEGVQMAGWRRISWDL